MVALIAFVESCFVLAIAGAALVVGEGGAAGGLFLLALVLLVPIVSSASALHFLQRQRASEFPAQSDEADDALAQGGRVACRH